MKYVLPIALIAFLVSCSDHHDSDSNSSSLMLPAPPQRVALADTAQISPHVSGEAR